MSEDCTPSVRERTILTVMDHSGERPVLVAEHEWIFDDGRLVFRDMRAVAPPADEPGAKGEVG